MFKVSRQIEFCYGHRLLDYEGKCRHLHGHNGKVLITIEASGLDEQGMVLDFGEIKRVVSDCTDRCLRVSSTVCRLRASLCFVHSEGG